MKPLFLLPLTTGVISGLAVSFFIPTLGKVVELNLSHPELIYLLPAMGALLGFLYPFFGKAGKTDTAQILEEIHDPKEILPLRFAPLVYLTTLLSHLVGASVGREGAAVQIAASASDQLSRKFHLSAENRRSLLLCGIGSGLSAAIGTPIAGMIFGLELMKGKTFSIKRLLQCALASWGAYAVTQILHLERIDFPKLPAATNMEKSLITALIAGVLFGLLSRILFFCHSQFSIALQQLFKSPVIRGFLGGAIVLLLYRGFELDLYRGLGLNMILSSFVSSTPIEASLMKMLLTTLALSAGFKGGEFIPLVFIGATAGNTLNLYAQLPEPLLPALGCVTLFAAAAKTPITCILMGIELFGFQITPYVVPCVLVGYWLSGKKSLYHSTH